MLAFASEVRDRIVPKNFGVVEQGCIYRSGQISESLIEDVLSKHDIGVVVTLSRDKMEQSFTAAEVEAGERLGVTRLSYPLAGNGTGDLTQYANAVEAIENARKSGTPILVHCYAGTQRTGGAIAFWRVLVQGRPANEAFAEMQRYGHDPADNPDLIPYMNKHMGTLAMMLVDRNVIPAMPDRLPVMSAGTVE